MGNLSALTGLSMASHPEEMDPALADGHTVIYDREVPLEMRAESGGGSDACERKPRVALTPTLTSGSDAAGSRFTRTSDQ